MTDSFPLESFRAIAGAMQSEAADWQWIGRHESQRMFGITQARAESYAAQFGGTASPLEEVRPYLVAALNGRDEAVEEVKVWASSVEGAEETGRRRLVLEGWSPTVTVRARPSH